MGLPNAGGIGQGAVVSMGTSTRVTSNSMCEGIASSKDFEEAHDTITFEHAHVMFQLMGLHAGILSLVTRLLHSRVAFFIRGLVIPDVLWTPIAGIPQVDLFFPALFVIGFCHYPPYPNTHPNLHVRMYVDDLVIYEQCSANEVELLLQGPSFCARTN